MGNSIGHIINVGVGEIKTNSKGEQLKSIIIDGITYIYNEDKPLTTIMKISLPI